MTEKISATEATILENNLTATVGDLEVVGSGIVHTSPEHPLKVTINGLVINFLFPNNPDNKSFKISWALTKGVENSIDLQLENFNNSLGTGLLKPTEIGVLHGRKLFISFFVWTPNPTIELRIVNYALYLGEKR